jgi:hypothetical protein
MDSADAFVWWVLGIVVFLGLLANAAANAAQRKRVKEAKNFNPRASQGSARFATTADLKRAGMLKSGGIHIGFFEGRKIFVNVSAP